MLYYRGIRGIDIEFMINQDNYLLKFHHWYAYICKY